MSRKIAKIWAVVLFVSTFILLFGTTMVENVRTRGEKEYRVHEIKDWEVEKSTEKNERGMYTVTYRNTIDDIEPGGEFLLFMVYHADVRVYSRGDLLYSLYMDKSDVFFDAVSGDAWNAVYILEEYEGCEIEVIVETEYDSYLDYVPDFYFGERTDIVRDEFMRGASGLFLAVAIFVVGAIIVVHTYIVKRNKPDKYDIGYLGIFAIMLSIWFIINMPIINMVFDTGTTMTYLSYIILGAIALPLVLFQKKCMHKKYNKYCDMLCACLIVVQAACVIMQLTGVMDMKESLIFTHIGLGTTLFCIMIMLILNIKTVGWKQLPYLNKVNMLCGILTALGVAMDMVYFYIDEKNGKNYVFTKVAFLIHIALLCYNSMRETQRLVKKGKEANKLEKLAYKDELTGVFNRTAYNDYIKKIDLSESDYTVIMFDLNNLKECNDTHGHNVGDQYIMSCADAIREAFYMVGDCYRIGGDEFSIIARNISEDTIENCYCMLGARITIYNQEHPDVRMSVAYGHATYDAELDEDLKDTRGRADKNMYDNKAQMKKLYI